MKLIKIQYFLLSLLLILSMSCSNKNNYSSRHQHKKYSQSHPLSASALSLQGIRVPNQVSANKVPKQAGSMSNGYKVTLDNNDTPWTAFTLVLFMKSNGEYEVLTQMRAKHMRASGTIETMGGHLTSHQSWSQGAAAELEQESGINVAPKDLIYLNGNKRAAYYNNSLHKNANFFAIFQGTKPLTHNNSDEIDPAYGHRWLDLKTLYTEIMNEQNRITTGKPHQNGKFYGNFRLHLIELCRIGLRCR